MSGVAVLGGADPYATLGRPGRRLVACALLGCAFLAMLDGTVVGTALPRIVEQLGDGSSWYVWLVTAYLLTSSVSVPVYGRFSDLYGRRRLLLGGLTLFLVGSLACGFAGTLSALVVARAAQGLGAGALAAGLLLLVALVPVERRAAVPVLPLRLFTHHSYGALLTAGFFFQAAALPLGILTPLYFQHVRGYSATVSGLMLLPLLIGMTLGNRLTAALILRSGHTKPVLLAGAGLLTLGTASFAALGPTTPPPLTGLWLLLAGLGTGPAMGGLTIATQNAVPRADMGTATAGAALTKQLGGAVGLAVAQTLLARRPAAFGATSGSAPAPTDGRPGGHPGGGPGVAALGEALGHTVAWAGAVGGLLAVAALVSMRDVTLPSKSPRAGAGKPAGTPTVTR
ncbi:hypothetical protein ADL27_19580 [Streptomyces sp. NRRL F-6602]|nr:hypothetical protein ADL27_19580 [Streptomyces sp. NRRL F-6602]